MSKEKDAISRVCDHSSAARAGVSLLVFVTMSVTGCVWPVQPSKTNTNRTLIEAAHGNSEIKISSAEDAHNLVDGLYAVTTDQSKWRVIYEHSGDDTTFYGTLLAAIGVATGGIAARNIGAGVAGISTAVSSHYQFSQQRVAFERASARAKCLQEAMNDIDDSSLALFNGQPLDSFGTDVNGADDAWTRFPTETLSAVNNIVSALRQDLNQLSTPTGSLADIRALATQVKLAADAAAKLPAGSASQEAQSKLASAQSQLVDANTNYATISAKVNASGVVNASYLSRLIKDSAKTGAPVQLRKSLDPELMTSFKTAVDDQSRKAAALQIAQASVTTPYIKRRFLAALVQYQASAKICVALGAAATN